MMMLTRINTAKCATWITQKMSSSKGLVEKINLNVSLPMFRMLQVKAPVFRGLLRKNMTIQAMSDGNRALTYIRFPTSDVDNGHPYSWYAENGRRAIHGKLKPKMRFFPDPSNRLMYLNSPGLVFRTNVGAAHGSFFIRDTVAMYRGVIPMIASKEVAFWLQI